MMLIDRKGTWRQIKKIEVNPLVDEAILKIYAYESELEIKFANEYQIKTALEKLKTDKILDLNDYPDYKQRHYIG